MKKIAIIGGGAAGYFAAFHAAKYNSHESKVVLFEASKNVLAKVLVSGGGRCNVTNNTFDINELVKKYPRGQKELLSPFKQFGPQDTVNWFESRHVKLKTESDNRIFPVTDKSETISQCLEEAVRQVGVELRLNSKIVKILKSSREQLSFDLLLKAGEIETFDKVIIATGGVKLGYEIAENLGHSIVKPIPSLFTFEIANELLDGLSGISFKKVEISLKIGKKKFSNSGPLLITHWGLSGPAVIVLSSVAARELFEADYKSNIYINFLPQINADSAYKNFLKEKEDHPKRTILNSNIFFVPKTFWERILDVTKIEKRSTLQETSNKSLMLLAEILCNSKFLISGKGKFKEEFVTAGGINLKEIDFRTMGSKICPGLYFAGEVIDVDGVTGGFNFQAAWTTGYIAGCNA